MHKPVIALAAFAVFTTLVVANVQASFTDVSSTDPYFEAINYVQSNGIVSGYGDGTFRSKELISRAAFTKIIINSVVAEDEIITCNSIFFPDVQMDNNFRQYICVAKNRNIVNGFSDSKFHPGDNIGFGSAAKIITNAFGLNPDLSQNDEQNPFRAYINKLAEYKAIPISIEKIDSQITRGEMAEIIFRLKTNNTSKESKNYSDLVTTPISTPTKTPTPVATPIATPVSTPATVSCSADIHNCGNFSSWSDAQDVYDTCMQQTGKDIHRLDGDNDGVACESLS